MNVVSPELEIMDGICYRVNSSLYSTDRNPIRQPYESIETVDNDETFPDMEIESTGIYKSHFKLKIHVAKTFFPVLIGSKGTTKKRLEKETGATIIIPKMGCEGDTILLGQTQNIVISAKNRIEMIVLNARKRQCFTHFVSLPFTDQNFQNGFLNFKKAVLQKCPGIEESIFQNPSKLHLTIQMLVLNDNFERKLAANILDQCKCEISELLSKASLTELKVLMKGIEYMNDDPTAVDILYGNILCCEYPDILQQICNKIRLMFSKNGLIINEYENVKLHVTLMNTKFKQRKNSDEKKKRVKFNAQPILELFREFYFGEAVINRMDISVLGLKNSDGYYQQSATIEIP